MLVIFDCDGVLVDSEVIAAKVEAGILNEAGYRIGPEEMGHRFAGRTWPQIIAQVEEELGHSIPEELLEGAESKLDVHLAAEVKAVEGAHEALDRLDFARCVCSNSPGERLKLTLGKTGLYDRFRPYVFSAIEVRQGHGKPSPDVFLHAAETLEFDPAETIVVEDTTTGVAGAVAAEMRVVGFTGGSHSWPGHGEALMDAGALTVVRRHADLPSTINALAKWDSAVLNV
jgi:HAD superfamily hydrolase (TIGR01509 family)